MPPPTRLITNERAQGQARRASGVGAAGEAGHELGGKQRHGRGDVGRARVHAGQHQRRQRDERAAAGERILRARPQRGDEEDDEGGHASWPPRIRRNPAPPRWCSAISAARSSPTGGAVDDPPLARDHHPVGAVRAAEDERRERIVRAREARLVEREQGEVGFVARLDPADVGAPEAARRAFRRPAQDVAMGDLVGAVAQAADHQRVAHRLHHVGGIVGGRAVDAEADGEPAASSSQVGQMPEASTMFEAAQWQTPTPALPSRAISSALK